MWNYTIVFRDACIYTHIPIRYQSFKTEDEGIFRYLEIQVTIASYIIG